MINTQTFCATPAPADSLSPMEFTIERITRNDIPTRKSCNAIGEPIAMILLMTSPSHLICFRLNVKGSFFPDMSLQELGAQLDPPLGKSAVNHRLRRLMSIVEELKQ